MVQIIASSLLISLIITGISAWQVIKLETQAKPRVLEWANNGTHWLLKALPFHRITHMKDLNKYAISVSLNETILWADEMSRGPQPLFDHTLNDFQIGFTPDGRFFMISEYNIDENCVPLSESGGLQCKFLNPLRPGYCLRYTVVLRELEDSVWEVTNLGRFQNLTLQAARIEMDTKCDVVKHLAVSDPMENFSSLLIELNFDLPSNVTDAVRWLPPADCDPALNTTLDRVECKNITIIVKYAMEFAGIDSLFVNRASSQLIKFRCHLINTDDRFIQFVGHLLDHVERASSLRELDISGAKETRFCSWAVMAAAMARNLTHLTISDCRFTEIDSTISHWITKANFTKNPNTYTAHYAGELKDYFGVRMAEQSYQLERVDLAGNQLRQLPRWLHNLTSLTRANLSRQLLGPGERFSLSNSLLGTAPFLPALEVLDLSLVPLKDFTSNASRQFPRLRQLHLRQCGLTELEESVFEPLPLLSWLDLSGNHLSTLHSTLFSSLASLRTLHLCCNTFQSLQQPLLLGGTLAYLDLSHNQLGRHSLQIRSGNITSLNLSSNAIADWSSLQPLALTDRHVRRVDLSGNEIHLLEPQMRDELRDLLEVDLTGNLFDCKHCQLHELQHWISSNQHRLSGSEELFCEDPESKQRGLRVLEAPYNPECLPDLFLHVGVPLLAVSALLLLVGTLLYVYRFHVAYVRHLWKIKRQHEKRGPSAEEAVEYDAFVSYSSEDREWVMETLLPNMESEDQHGYRFCLHERDFEVGSYIMENIGHRIATSRHVVLLLSPHFVRSKWCQFELRLAQLRMFEDGTRGGADFLVLVQLQPLERRRLSNTLRLLMATRTFLEWPHNAVSAKGAEQSGQRRDFFKRLRAALGPPCKNKIDPLDISNLAYEEYEEEEV